MLLSFLIPARNEIHLQRTIENIIQNIRGDSEVLVALDGYKPDPPMPPEITNNPRVRFFSFEESIGQRAAINYLAKQSTADFICKIDAHCAIDEGFDVKMAADCEYDWTVIPRMYNLDIETFKPKLHKRTDYMYIGCDEGRMLRAEYYTGKEFKKWHSKPELIDDTMCCMGPCFFMRRDRFWELGGCDENHVGGWGQQGVEVALKAWLSGGSLKVNKKTWFSHYFRGGGGPGFPYPISGRQVERVRQYSRDLWLNDKWEGQKRKFQWVIEKFNPPGWNPKTLTYIPSGAWYQEATINGVKMPTQRRNDTSEKRWAAFMQPLIPNGTGTVIDLGCNAGFNSRKMVDLGYSAIGIELDKTYFSHATFWEEQDPKGVKLINDNIMNYEIPPAKYAIMTNIHYWLSPEELKTLVERFESKVEKAVVIGRHKDDPSHRSKPDIETLKVTFKDWEIEKTIIGKKHYSVLFINKKIIKDQPKPTIEIDVDTFFEKQDCAKSRKFYPSFKKLIETGDDTDFVNYLIWRKTNDRQNRFQDTEKVLEHKKKLIARIKETQKVEPVVLVGDKLIDGDHRLIIAKVLGIKKIQGMVVPAEDAQKYIDRGPVK